MSSVKTQQDVKGSTSSQDQLKSYVARIERLDEEKSVLGEDIKEVFNEAKSNGFDVKVMKEIIRLRKKDPSELAELETLLDVYKAALGMI